MIHDVVISHSQLLLAKLIIEVATSLVLDFVFFIKIFIFFPNMARRSTIYHHEPKEWFPCRVHDCSRKFRTQARRTKHIHSKHKKNYLQTGTRSPLSVSLEIPPATAASVSSINSDHHDADINMPDVRHVPCTPHHDVQLVASNSDIVGFDLDDSDKNMTRTQSPHPFIFPTTMIHHHLHRFNFKLIKLIKLSHPQIIHLLMVCIFSLSC